MRLGAFETADCVVVTFPQSIQNYWRETLLSVVLQHVRSVFIMYCTCSPVHCCKLFVTIIKTQMKTCEICVNTRAFVFRSMILSVGWAFCFCGNPKNYVLLKKEHLHTAVHVLTQLQQVSMYRLHVYLGDI